MAFPDDSKKLRPRLMAANWAGRTSKVCRPLLELTAPSPYMPHVALGYGHGQTFEFVDAKHLAEMEATAKMLEALGIAVLRERPAEWKPMDLDLSGQTLRILTYTDDEFAAERVLDAISMQRAQQLLNADALFVGVPRRGLLMAIDGMQAEPLLRAFGAAVAGQFTRGESEVISPAVLTMQDGVLVGFLDQIARRDVPVA